jgi:nucleoside-diphosphate-sugar epimerase
VSGRRVLVTGAGGFIGGRIAEVLHLRGDEPRAGVRRWSSAARVGRLPVDIVACDVRDPDQLARAMAGVSAVVHCAVGDREVTVAGTRNVLECAARLGIQRVVHLSTIDVYGAATGRVDENTPLQKTGAPYGDSKIEAEEVCRELVTQVPLVILRPTIVYGPFSASWTIEWALRLQSRPWQLAAEDCQGTCNLLYVDDLALAVLQALEAQSASGQALNVNGPESLTWHEYFERLNDALGLPPLVGQSGIVSHARARLMSPIRKTAKLAMAHFNDPIMKIYQRSHLAKLAMRQAEAAIRATPTSNEFALLGRTASYPTERAAAVIGYAPRFSVKAGIALSVAWLRHHGYVRGAVGG